MDCHSTTHSNQIRTNKKYGWEMIFSLIALALTVSCNTLNTRYSNRSPTISRSFFGMHIHHASDPSMSQDYWPNFQFGSWRLWDAGVNWYALEPSEGKWNFARLDHYVAIAKEKNIDLILPLGMPPQWASSQPKRSTPYGVFGASSPPADMGEWRAYVRAVGERYKGVIHNYEIWNEPQDPRFYSGSPSQLVELVKEASGILKSIDPGVSIISPPVTGDNSRCLNYLNKFLELGGGKYVDIFSYHFYTPTKPPEAAIENIRAVKSILYSHGEGQKPLWNTETGWQISNLGADQEVREAGWKVLGATDESAGYLARAYLVNANERVGRLYWYAWDDRNMGMVSLPGHAPKEIASAYSNLEKWLVGHELEPCKVTWNVWKCAVSNKGNEIGWIVWVANTSQSSVLSSTAQIFVPDKCVKCFANGLDGSVMSISTSTFRVNGIPQFISLAKIA